MVHDYTLGTTPSEKKTITDVVMPVRAHVRTQDRNRVKHTNGQRERERERESVSVPRCAEVPGLAHQFPRSSGAQAHTRPRKIHTPTRTRPAHEHTKGSAPVFHERRRFHRPAWHLSVSSELSTGPVRGPDLRSTIPPIYCCPSLCLCLFHSSIAVMCVASPYRGR